MALNTQKEQISGVQAAPASSVFRSEPQFNSEPAGPLRAAPAPRVQQCQGHEEHRKPHKSIPALGIRGHSTWQCLLSTDLGALWRHPVLPAVSEPSKQPAGAPTAPPLEPPECPKGFALPRLLILGK